MISPTPGRIVWYRPASHESIIAHGSDPLAAMVVAVWHDRMVNLTVWDANGCQHSRTSVQLLQDGDVSHGGSYCEWMPYQKGQAAKAEGR
jgi:hypothetical protein